MFCFSPIHGKSVLKLLQQIDPSKAVGLDNLGGRTLASYHTTYKSFHSNFSFSRSMQNRKIKTSLQKRALLLSQKTIAQFHCFHLFQNYLKKSYICKPKVSISIIPVKSALAMPVKICSLCTDRQVSVECIVRKPDWYL